jgi:hypothetical protein
MRRALCCCLAALAPNASGHFVMFVTDSPHAITRRPLNSGGEVTRESMAIPRGAPDTRLRIGLAVESVREKNVGISRAGCLHCPATMASLQGNASSQGMLRSA